MASLSVEATATVKDVFTWAAGEVVFLHLHHEAQTLRLVIPDERAALDRSDDEWVKASQDAVKHAATAALKKHRAIVSAIGGARLGGPGLGRAIGSSLKGARGWGCTALSVNQSFPLEPGILDTVLIDEASQCTLAVALPLAFRAKNLVIVGDPNQLTPIIKVDKEHLRSLAASCGLDPAVLGQAGMGYGDGSAFTAFAHVVGLDQVSLLDEHFRCHPAIARWFNSMFYGGQLRVLTDVAGLAKGERGLVWVDVLGKAEAGLASGAHNPIEAQLIVEAIGVELDRGVSIGVVTPFAAQASEIRRMARERYSEEALESVDFTSGTAHRLQGNERDVVFFSCVVADGIRSGTARWVERERNLLNVAVSRAKARLVVFGHPNVGSLGVPSLAALRIAAIEGHADSGEASWLIHSEAEGLLLDGLYGAGFSPLLKPIEEGYELDFALIGSRGRLNIEVDGDHHFDNAGRQRRQDLVRDRVLEGLRWRVVRVPTWRCYRDMERVIAEIVAEFALCT